MTENLDDIVDVDMSNMELTFANLVILKEFGSIINLVRNEDFLETVPKAKLRRVKWVPMFKCLKQGIFDEMVQELTTMWEYENMPEKFETLKKQKEKFQDMNEDQVLWRPQLGDVRAQLRASDVANLRKQKALLESLAKEYEVRVSRLKKILSAKRGYLKAFQMDMQKYQKKNEEIIAKVNDRFQNHDSLVKIIQPDEVNIDEIVQADRDMEINEIN